MTNGEQAIREFAEKWATVWFNAVCERRSNADDLISDLTALISEHYYPKEFTVWLGFMSSRIKYREFDDKWLWIYYDEAIMDDACKEYTLDELFNYWKENEQEEHPTNKEKFDGNYLPDPE